METKNEINSLGEITPGKWIPFWSNGNWSMHQLLEYVLAFTGPAKVFLTAFSLSEEPVRKLLLLKDAGQITELRCLFNDQLKRFKTDILVFSSNVADEIRTVPVHAKVILIEGRFNVMIIGSANLNRNDRYEAGVICSDQEAFNKMNLSVMLTWQFATPLNYD